MAAPSKSESAVRLLWRRLLLLGLVLLLFAAFSGVWNIYRKERESAELKREAQAQLSDLQQRQSQLSVDVASLQTERGMEAALRQQYTVGNSGEGLVVIVEPATSSLPATSTSFMDWFKKAFPWW